MDTSSLLDFARFKPLAAWSLSSAVLGAALAFFLSGGEIAEPWPMAAAMVCIVLLQYVSHPLNDITDRELDARAAIAATGRKKPLVNGSATVNEARKLSAAIMVVILVIMAGLILFRPLLMAPAAYGVFAVLGYSHPGLRLSYRPFTELYLGVPVNVIAVLVITYIGAGTISVLAVLIAITFAFAASSIFVSMMSMDYATDRADRKETTVVRYPRSRWCAVFPAIGLAAFIISLPLAASSLSVAAFISLAALASATFFVLIVVGARADRLRFDYLDGVSVDIEARSNGLRLKQLYASVLFAVGSSVIFLQQGA